MKTRDNPKQLQNTKPKQKIVPGVTGKASPETSSRSPLQAAIDFRTCCPCDGFCPHCTLAPSTPLSIGRPNDRYEQEANRIADESVRCSPGEKTVSREANQAGNRSVTRLPGTGSSSLASRLTNGSSGKPLENKKLQEWETIFGFDFSTVRIHTDDNAVRMNRALNAKAFTSGKDIFFGAGVFNPDTRSGRRLLAHELAHVVQQTNSETAPQIQREQERVNCSTVTDPFHFWQAHVWLPLGDIEENLRDPDEQGYADQISALREVFRNAQLLYGCMRQNRYTARDTSYIRDTLSQLQTALSRMVQDNPNFRGPLQRALDSASAAMYSDPGLPHSFLPGP